MGVDAPGRIRLRMIRGRNSIYVTVLAVGPFLMAAS